MKTIIFNVGSTNLKYNLYDKRQITQRKIYYKNSKQLKDKIKKVLSFKPDLIIHRVVHGGDMKNSVITNSILKKLEKLNELAPLHNPRQLEVIKICRRLSKAKQIAVFDTAFFLDLPKISKTYALPKKLAKKYHIQRYGFHGINHRFMESYVKKRKVITCHLGAGSSITAWSNHKPLDTSMGFTPLEGVMMVTRTGSIDPSIALFLQEKLKLTPKNVLKLLNEKSGFYGLTGSKDIEKIVNQRKKYRLAFELFCYSIAKQISAYVATLNGLDCLVFSGGIGELSWPTRERICSYLKHLGLKLSRTDNIKNKEVISSSYSKIKVFVVKANEAEVMLGEVKKILK
ncbi:MAG: acetate/propionate family kinase [archaeon]|nr:MAG: acetate/propionate family kinase [archaeon]